MRYKKARFLGNESIEVVEDELRPPADGEVKLRTMCRPLWE